MRQFAESFPEHTTARQDLAGYAELVTAEATDGNADEKREKCFAAAAHLAATLQTKAPTYSVGILTRGNAAIGHLIHHLENLGVEASQEGGNPLTDSKSVERILSALMMSEHPGDKRWAFHVAGSPLAQINGIGPSWIRQSIDDRGIAETIENLASILAPVCDARDTLRLKQLTRLAIQYEPNATDRLRDFIDLVRNKRVERPQEARVRVMTIHQAKGLEFDTVILPQLDSDLTKYSNKPVALLDRPGGIPTGLTRNIKKDKWPLRSKEMARSVWRERGRFDDRSVVLTLRRNDSGQTVSPHDHFSDEKGDQRPQNAWLLGLSCAGL